jgi:hypothetical protein
VEDEVVGVQGQTPPDVPFNPHVVRHCILEIDELLGVLYWFDELADFEAAELF